MSSFVLRWLSAALLFAIASGAHAASLSISPLVVTLDQKKHSATLILKNEGNEPRVIQTELLRWTQENGKNIYSPTRDLLANPPISTVKPGQTQIIRIGLNRKADKNQELAYRVYVSEVPPPLKEGSIGLRVALRFGVAAFVAPDAAPNARLDWKGSRAGNDLTLELFNGGNRHQRITSLKINDPDTGRQLAEWKQSHILLLAGQGRQISLPLPSDWQGSQLGLVATVDNGLIETKVELDPPAR